MTDYDENLDWKIYDQLRNSPQQITPKKYVSYYRKETGNLPSWEHLRTSMIRARAMGVWLIPPTVVSFIKKYSNKRKVSSVLDLSSNFGEIPIELSKDPNIEKIRSYIINTENFDVANLMDNENKVSWTNGVWQNDNQEYDLIVSTPPFGQKPEKRKYKTKDGSTIDAIDSPSYLDLISSLKCLSQSGTAILLAPDAFLFKQGNTVKHLLPSIGYCLNAVIKLPSGVLAPYTNISVNLCIVSKEQSSDVFWAYLSDESQIDEILNNFYSRTNARNYRLGLLTKHEQFLTWGQIEAEKEIEKTRPKGPYETAKLEDIALEINRPKKNEDGELVFEDKPNSIYIPAIGNGPAVSALDELNIKAQNYIQVVLNGTRSKAAYLSGYFSSNYGLLVRRGVQSGTTIPRISLASIKSCEVLLPNLDLQEKIAENQQKIRELDVQLNEVLQKLQANPYKLDETTEFIAKFSNKEATEQSFSNWIETLPFPVASILWRYHAEFEERKKAEHLLNFFESLAEFSACLLLSAFRSNQALLEENKGKWFGETESVSLRRATFGFWVTLAEQCAKKLRTMFSSKDDRDLAFQLFGIANNKNTTQPKFIDSITDKKLFSALKIANQLRNDLSHSGVKTEKKYKDILSQLEQELISLRALLSFNFEDWPLIRPKSIDYNGNEFSCTVELIKGSRSPFEISKITSSVPLANTKLYLYNPGQISALEILPFFKMMSSPKTEENACYFYNRADKKGVRWVSYHFDREDEVTNEDQELIHTIEELQA